MDVTDKLLKEMKDVGEKAEDFGKRLATNEKELGETRSANERLEAELAEVKADTLKKRAAKPGEKYGSGKYREFTAGNMTAILGMVNQREVSGSIKLDGFERVNEGLVVSGDNANKMVDVAEEMLGTSISRTVDGKRVVTTSQLAAVIPNTLDNELWARARDNNAVWPFLRSPAGTVNTGTRAALRGELLYMQPKAQTADYSVDDRVPQSTTRNMFTLAKATQFSPEGMVDADVNLMQLATEDMLEGMSASIDNVIFNADNTANATNINSDGFTGTNTTDDYLTTYRIANNVAGLRARALADANIATNVGAALDLSSLSKIVNRLPTSRPKIVVVNRDTLTSIMGNSGLTSAAEAGRLATILFGEPGSLFQHRLIVNDQLPMTDADGKVTRTSTGGFATNNPNTKGSVLVLDPQYYEIAFGIRPVISIDRIVSSGNVQAAIRAYLSFVGFNDQSGFTSGTTVDRGSHYGYNVTV